MAHPGIEIVTRDRSISYAEGISYGLPEAEEVADRWHLLKNLSELVESILLNEQSAIKQAFQMTYLTNKEPPPKSITEAEPNPTNEIGSETDANRRELYKKTKEMFAQDLSRRKIGRELGIIRNTVRKYLRATDFPNRQTGQGSKSKLRKYAKFLRQRWKEGEQNAQKLFVEIQKQGFSGSVSAVRKFVQKWREFSDKLIKPLIPKCYSSRKTTKMLLLESEENGEKEFLEKLCELSPKVAQLQKLGVEFRVMIREKREKLFDEWLKKVEQSEISELKNWVVFLLLDEKAVRSAMTSEWSNGQTEEQVNRLKTIKRQMYGRANFDLLKAKVLYQN